ncbi:hypothetical protein LguiA_029678 [Lonicera macranthoides]
MKSGAGRYKWWDLGREKMIERRRPFENSRWGEFTHSRCIVHHMWDKPQSMYSTSSVAEFSWPTFSASTLAEQYLAKYVVNDSKTFQQQSYGKSFHIKRIPQKGKKNIEGILLHHQRERKLIDIATEAFRAMHKLRLLVVRNVWNPRVPEYLPSELQWLIWEEFPSESLPPRFEAENLVGLQLYQSGIERPWRGGKMMEKLKYIDLSYSQKLMKTPDFTWTPNLKSLILKGCKSLVEIHKSVGFLKRLACLDLSGCSNLKSLPNCIHLDSLETFRLTGCHQIKKIPEFFVIMEHLSELHLQETAIGELPSSIEYLPNLVLIDLTNCKNLANLPSTFCKLKCLRKLFLSNCSKFDKLPEDLGYLKSLTVLSLERTAIKELPSSIEHVNGLVSLRLIDCNNLLSLPSAICKLKRLEYLSVSGCSELETLPEDLRSLGCLKALGLDGTAITHVPLSIGGLNNLNFLSCRKSPQSSTSPFQFLFPLKRKWKEDPTRNLVLLSVSGLH